jgi:hypothetical protein
VIGRNEQVFGVNNKSPRWGKATKKRQSELAKKRFPMLSWAEFYRGLANEATLRAAQMANASEKDELEEVAKEWSTLAEWVERRHRYS